MPEADAVLLAAVEVARNALREGTPDSAVGEPAGYLVEDEHTLSLFFACRLAGYPGWHWSVTLTRVDDGSAPTVVETELMPGESALLAPDWVPWSVRLAEYRASQEARPTAEDGGAEDGGAEDDGAEDDSADDLDDDELDRDFDELDGVDFDEALEDEELAALDREVDDADDAEGEAGDGDPEPPAVAAETAPEDQE